MFAQNPRNLLNNKKTNAFLFSAMGGDDAREFYLQFLQQLRKGHPGGDEMVKDGQFGAYMQVNIQNDGPVTLELECLPSDPEGTNKANSKTVDSSPVTDSISPECG